MSIKVISYQNRSATIGQVSHNGEIYDGNGYHRGKITPNGELRNVQGTLIGKIYQNGAITKVAGTNENLILTPAGEIFINGQAIGRMNMAWRMQIPDTCAAYAAAYLIQCSIR